MDDIVTPKVYRVGKENILDRIEKKFGHRAELAIALIGKENLMLIEKILDYNLSMELKDAASD